MNAISPVFKSDNIDFNEAMVQIQMGNKLTRLGWKRPGMYIWLPKGDKYPEEIRISFHKEKSSIWVSRQDDREAKDWRIIA